jgi:hypothetical protein
MRTLIIAVFLTAVFLIGAHAAVEVINIRQAQTLTLLSIE